MAAEPLKQIDVLDRLRELIGQARGLDMALGGADLDETERDALETLADALVRGMVELHAELGAARADAGARLALHIAGAEAAMRDLFPTASVKVEGNCLGGAHSLFGGIGGPAHVQITASRGIAP